MKRYLMGAAIGFATFLIGLVPSFYPFEGLFVNHGGGLSNCVVHFEPQSFSSEFEDHRAVYNTIVEDESHGRRYVVLLDRTSAPVWFSGVDSNYNLPGLDTEIHAYESANQDSLKLKNFISSDRIANFFSAEDNSTLFVAGSRGWHAFDKRFPSARGLVSFSAIGFNPSHNRALVNVHTRCGLKCSDDKFDLLIKTGGRWIIRTKYIQWNAKS